jgi:hypothetical protein
VKDPASVQRTLKQVLDQFYALQDRHAELQSQMQTTVKGTTQSKGALAGSGPTDTMLLGLRVAPVDTSTLIDGVKLTYVKAQGRFEFI